MRIERENIFLKKTSWLVQAGIVLWAAFLLAALAGCNSKPGSDVMATVDGRKIFRSDVDKYYDTMSPRRNSLPPENRRPHFG